MKPEGEVEAGRRHPRLLLASLGMVAFIVTLAIAGVVWQMTANEAQEQATPEAVWRKECKTPDKNKCFAIWESLHPSGLRILRFEISRTEKANSFQMVIVVPFGVFVNQPLRVRIAEEEIARTNITSCLSIGCVAQLVELDRSMLDRMRKGKRMDVIVTVPGEDGTTITETVLEATLDGFAEVIGSL